MTDRPSSAKNKSGSTATQFRKGHSGNPAGRPRKKALPTAADPDLDSLLALQLPVTGMDGEQKMPITDALLLRIYRDAIAGKRMAQRDLIKRIVEWYDGLDATQRMAVSVPSFIHEQDPDNADEALVILEIVSVDPDRSQIEGRRNLLIEPWAAQAAVDRLSRTAFTTKDITDIEWGLRDHKLPQPQGRRRREP